MITIQQVQLKFKENRHNYDENLKLRIHRSLSWLQQANNDSDLDTQFIHLWISFNAVYAREIGAGLRNVDKGLFIEFLHKICALDKDHNIYDIVWNIYSGSIRILLNNQFTFQPFWDFHNGLISESSWKNSFDKNKQKALNALSDKDTPTILMSVFNHLYTLRNQIIHGGSTFNSSINRAQLADSCNILMTLVPNMIDIMLNHPNENAWGKPFYPVIDD